MCAEDTQTSEQGVSQNNIEKDAPSYQIEDILVDNKPLLFSEPWNKSADDWLQILVQTDFKGNPYNAADYVFHFARGMKLVMDRLEKRGLKIPVSPQLSIVNSDVPSWAFSGYRVEDGEVTRIAYLNKQGLERISANSEDDSVAISQQEKRVFVGKISSLARNAGIEEAHHTIFNQFKDKKGAYVASSSVTSAEYDAEDAEYRALLQQLGITISERDHLETIQVITDRVESAKKVRLERAMPEQNTVL
jgi:hypothetical protein